MNPVIPFPRDLLPAVAPDIEALKTSLPVLKEIAMKRRLLIHENWLNEINALSPGDTVG